MKKLNDNEREGYGSTKNRAADVIQSILDSDKAVNIQKWEQLWDQLDSIEAQLETSATTSAEPLYHVLVRLIAEARILCHKEIQDKQTCPGNPEPLLEYIQQLAQLKTINDLNPLQGSSLDPRFWALYDQWIRERLQERWTERYARSQERAILRERETHAQEEDQAALEAILDEKRALQRNTFQACVTEQLSEIQELQDQLETAAARELEDTITLYTQQLGILLEGTVTLSDAVSDVVDTRIGITEALMSTLEHIQLEISHLKVALDSMGQRTRKMLMRIDRLNAGDVQSGSDREWEQQRRLVRPQAALYIIKAAQDAEDISTRAKDAKQSITVIDHDLARMLGHAKDRWRPLEMQTYLAWSLLERRQMTNDY